MRGQPPPPRRVAVEFPRVRLELSRRDAQRLLDYLDRRHTDAAQRLRWRLREALGQEGMVID